MLTAFKLLTAIKTAEWSRYTGSGAYGYATASLYVDGDVIDLRCPLPLSVHDHPQFIEYRRADQPYGPWLLTGFAACMRYDEGRDHQDLNDDGYEFIPYRVTSLKQVK